ncbi:MAG: hypothetical protein JWR21_2346 [Herminiimonas sp.]|jgi:hypothetical protein|nr:hypothetical protein [Herminiimonas sp.]MDB5854205.1 hypothetical protein [Herminiimonas sp.]
MSSAIPESIQLLMQEIGPATLEIDAVMQSEEGSWAVQFDDETVVQIEWADEPSRLVLSSALGQARPEMRLPVYETLLSYNLLWQDTGGVKAALAGPGGEVSLLYEMFADTELSLSDLRTVLLNFMQLTQLWASYVKSDASTPVNAPMPTEEMHLRA